MAMPTYNPSGAFAAGVQLHDQQLERIKRQALSPRQLDLNRLWAFYYCDQYEARSITWDGRPVLDNVERESIARSQVLPPGFYDPSGKFDEMPLSMRKPTAPYHLVRVVVNRFTGLLFSAKKHPTIHVADRPEVQSWIEGLIKSARLWIRMAYARTFGGAMGAVAVTFRFKNGRPVIDVHDPRWCMPTFKDRATGEVSQLEIRYMYAQEVPDERGILRETWFWYRRIIDEQGDTVFAPAPVGDGDEPIWQVADHVDHGFGEFPGVWIRNSQTEEQDGEPDCHGVFDTQEAIDRLISQADQGAVENCDPTLLLQSNELKLADLRKGSNNAIKVEVGGGGQYLEMSGGGVNAAVQMINLHRRNFLETVQCILDGENNSGTMTATEIERRYSSMHERGDLFREQYGEHGVKPLIAKMVRAAIKLRTGKLDPSGMRIVGAVRLPRARTPEGQHIDRELPADLQTITDDEIELQWPEWIQRGPADASAAAGAVATARAAGAVDQETAVTFLAPFFSIDNPAEALSRLRSEAGALDLEFMAALHARQQPSQLGDPAASQVPTPHAPSSPAPTLGLPGPGPAAAAAPPASSSPAPGPAPGSPGPDPATGKAADVALNGAQVTAALEIASKVTTGEIAPEAATLMLVAFGLVADVEIARKIVEAQASGARPPAPASPVGPPVGPPPPPAAPGAG